MKTLRFSCQNEKSRLTNRVINPHPLGTQTFVTTISNVQNASKAELYGIEIGLVKDFSFLPHPFFEDVGIIANASFIDGDFDIERPNIVDPTIMETPGFIPQQPSEIYNLVL